MLYEFLQEFKQDVSEFKTEMREFKQEMREFKKDVNNRFNQIDNRFDQIDKRIDRIESNVEDIHKCRHEIKIRFNWNLAIASVAISSGVSVVVFLMMSSLFIK